MFTFLFLHGDFSIPVVVAVVDFAELHRKMVPRIRMMIGVAMGVRMLLRHSSWACPPRTSVAVDDAVVDVDQYNMVRVLVLGRRQRR